MTKTKTNKKDDDTVYCIVISTSCWEDEEPEYDKDYYRGKKAIDLITSTINNCCACSEIDDVYKVHPDDVKKIAKRNKIMTFEDAEDRVYDIFSYLDPKDDENLITNIMTDKNYKKYQKYLSDDIIDEWKEIHEGKIQYFVRRYDVENEIVNESVEFDYKEDALDEAECEVAKWQKFYSLPRNKNRTPDSYIKVIKCLVKDDEIVDNTEKVIKTFKI